MSSHHTARFKGGESENNSCSGEELNDKAFNDNSMTEFIETIKNSPKTEKDLEIIVKKFKSIK